MRSVYIYSMKEEKTIFKPLAAFPAWLVLVVYSG